MITRTDLTPIQIQLLRYLSTGTTMKVVARACGKSVRTVEIQTYALRNKFRAKNNVHLCLLAIKYGLIDMDELLEVIGLKEVIEDGEYQD